MAMKVLGLLGLAVLLTLLMVQVNQREGQAKPRLVFPSLKEQLSALEKIEVTGTDGETVTLMSSADGWVLSEKANYPVSFEQLSRFLNNLATLEIAENKTEKPSNHKILGVADYLDSDNETQSAQTDAGVGARVRLLPMDLELIVGKDSKTSGTFVRYENNPRVYLTNETIEVSANAIRWVDPTLINIEAANIKEVTVSTRSGRFMSGSRDEESGEFRLAAVPEHRTLKYETIVDTLPRALSNVRMLDLHHYQPDLFLDPSTARFTLLTGETITVSSVRRDSGFWVHVDREDLAAWEFEVSELTYQSFNKDMESMLAPDEVEDDEF